MAPKLYVETTVLSYLAARPSRDLIVAAHQQLTTEWWHQRRSEFELYVSQLVLEEVEAGDPDVARRRLDLVEGIPLLKLEPPILTLAQALIQAGPLPAKAAGDALHIAIAAAHGMDYLLTWNCTHIANAQMRSRIERLCRSRGYEPPVMCTPEELMGD